MILLHAAGDSAGLAALTARAEDGALMASIGANFDSTRRRGARVAWGFDPQHRSERKTASTIDLSGRRADP